MASYLDSLLSARQRGLRGREAFQRDMHFPEGYAEKLTLTHTLNGHTGCVNRLAWNGDGSLLLSGSDDRKALIWHYPDVDRMPLAVTTEHRANIFGVQFLPCTGDRRIVTGAMDNTVQLHDLDATPAALPFASRRAAMAAAGSASRRHAEARGQLAVRTVTPRTRVYFSHKDRVKDVKTEPLNPHNFWSGGEDGIVRQYDTRLPNQDKWESPTVLVQIYGEQVKSFDINRAHPHQLVVAGSQPYLRLYDRRKLSAGPYQQAHRVAAGHALTSLAGGGGGSGGPGVSTPALLSIAPLHLPLSGEARGHHARTHPTYVSFSNKGDKVVATYHSDHAYSFDVTSSGELQGAFIVPQGAAATQHRHHHHHQQAAGVHAQQRGGAPCSTSDDDGPSTSGRGNTASLPLPRQADEEKQRGNMALFDKRWSAAVQAFSNALHYAPGAAVLYCLRAEAYLGRGWGGDAVLALRDCDVSCGLDPAFTRPHLRRIQVLQALHQYQSALHAVEDYQRRFPGRARDDLARLREQLLAAVEERRRLHDARRQQSQRRRNTRNEALASAPGPRQRRAGAGAAATPAAGQQGGPAQAQAQQHHTSSMPDVLTSLDAGTSPAALAPAGPDEAVADTPMTARSADAAAATAGGSSVASRRRRHGAAAAAAAGGGESVPYNPQRQRRPANEDDDSDHDVDDDDDDDRMSGGSLERGRSHAGGAGAADSDDGGYTITVTHRDADEEEEGPEAGSARRGSRSGATGKPDPDPESDPDADEAFLQYYADLLGPPDARQRRGGAAEQQQQQSDAAGMRVRVGGVWGHSPSGLRMVCRYVGHCNVQTDIKEANFVGAGDRLVACGSDDGRVFIYNAATGALLRALQADEDVANCVQCHPHLPVLATSGIESAVKLWEPSLAPPALAHDGLAAAAAAQAAPQPRRRCVVDDADTLAAITSSNQERMKEGPSMLRASMLQHVLAENPHLLQFLAGQLYGGGPGGERDGAGGEGGGAGEDGGEEGERPAEVSCRMN